MGGYPLEEPRVGEGRCASRTERGVLKKDTPFAASTVAGVLPRGFGLHACRSWCNYFVVVRLVAALGLYAQRRARLGGCCGGWDVFPSGRDADGAGLGVLLAD